MERPVSDDSGGDGGERVRTWRSRAASEMERWKDKFEGRGGENVCAGREE